MGCVLHVQAEPCTAPCSRMRNVRCTETNLACTDFEAHNKKQKSLVSLTKV